MMWNFFLELIQVSVGNRPQLSRTLNDNEWDILYNIARKQALVGVCFGGIDKLPSEQRPYKQLLLNWMGATLQIENRNRIMNLRTNQAVQFFRKNGFKTAILKGQGIARLYPQPDRRQSGDIDLWLGGSCKEIYDFARKNDPEHKLHGQAYHHIHFNLFDDVDIEVHNYPSYMHNPVLNSRLHHFFNQYPPTDISDVPSNLFNRIFILLHCFRHLNWRGVGLRQVMDYYYVLLQDCSEEENKTTLFWLKKLKLQRFAGGMSWVIHQVFGLDYNRMIVPPNETEGAFLMDEIRLSGNMGYYDKRNWGSIKTPIARFFHNIRHSLHFVSHYPSEALWMPFFNIYCYVRNRGGKE